MKAKKQANKKALVKALLRADDALVEAIDKIVKAQADIDNCIRVIEIPDKLEK